MKPSNLTEINKAFTAQAAGFESQKLHLSKQEYLDYTVRMTAPQITDSVLEVAAGTCVCGRSLAPHAGHVICLDATPAMLEVGRAECGKAGIDNISFIKGYAEELPFLDESFDIVISRLAFHHFAGAEEPFKEMVRVLKPGGKLVMIDMVPDDAALRNEVDRIERMRDPSHVRDLIPDEMKELYDSNGLSLAVQERTDIPVSLEAWMDLTKPADDTRKKIKAMMLNDMEGKIITGFSPYLMEEQIHFNQHWILNIGIKVSKKMAMVPNR